MAHLDGAIVEEAVDDLLLCCRHGLVQEAHAILQRVQQRLVVHICQVGLQVSRLQLHKGDAHMSQRPKKMAMLVSKRNSLEDQCWCNNTAKCRA